MTDACERPILFSAPMVRAILAGNKTQTRRTLKPQPREWQAMVIDVGTPMRNIGEDGEEIKDDWGQVETVWSSPLVPGMCEPHHEEWLPIKTYKIGDLLWVRETWKPHSSWATTRPSEIPESRVFYRADDTYAPSMTPWRPAIFMPRWASRITLRVTEVRVQRLQDISEEDAAAEGVYYEAPTQQEQDEYRAEHLDEYGVEPEPLDGVWIAPGTRTGFGPNPNSPKWGPTAATAYRWVWESINGKESWKANPWVSAYTFERVK